MKRIASVLFLFALLFSVSCQKSCKKEPKVAPTGNKTVSVTFKSPVGPVGRPYNITVSFSSPMVPITNIGKIEGRGPIKITPDVRGSFHWLGTKTVSFVPDDPFPYATGFKAKIAEDTTDINGDGLIEPVEWQFETARPYLLYSEPSSYATEVSADENILLQFNQPVDPDTVNKHIKLTAKIPDGKPAEIKVSTRRPSEKEWKEISWSGKNIENAVIVLPKDKFPLNAEIKFEIDENLTGNEGKLPAGKPIGVSFSTYGPLKIKKFKCNSEKCDPFDSLTFEFTNSVIPKDAVKHIFFSPEVELSDESDWETSYLYIFGPFKPNTEYTVRVKGSLTDIHGNKLGEDKEFKFKTAHINPSLSMLTGPGVVEAEGPGAIGVMTTNVKTLNADFKKLSAEDLIYELTEAGISNAAARTNDPGSFFSYRDRIAVDPKEDTAKAVPVGLEKALAGAKYGIIHLDVSSPEVYYETTKDGVKASELYHYTALIQVTDIGITAKYSDRGLIVWATSFSKGEPIADANVKMLDSSGMTVWEGKTSEGGVATPNVGGIDTGATTLYALVEKGGDLAYSSSSYEWSQGFSAWDFGLSEEWGDEATRAYLFTERGIYKPGETIHFKAIVRKVTDAGIVIPKGIKGVVIATDGRGRKYFSQDVKFTEYGSASADIEIPAEAAAGSGGVSLAVREEEPVKKEEKTGDAEKPGEKKEKPAWKSFYTHVEIAVYRPAEFKLEVNPAATDYIAGKKIEADVKADYLFGEPMSGAKVSWSIYRTPGYFWPENFSDYTFEPLTYYDYDEEEEDQYGTMELAGESSGLLDEKGGIKIDIPTKKGEISRTTNYILEATVTDINDVSISDRAAITVHPGEFYIGLKAPSIFAAAGQPFDVGVISVGTDEKVVTGKSIKVALLKREWHSVKKKAVVGYTYESKPVDTEVSSCSVRTGEKPEKCNLTAKASGTHIIKATSKDSGGNKIESAEWLYVTGAGEAAWKPEPHDRIEVVADKKDYSPGDTAKVMIKSPFATSHALITYERDGIIHQETRTLESFAPMIEIPIKDEYIPNIFFSAVLVKGRVSDELSPEGKDEGRPMVKVGYTELSVSPSAKKLNVVVTADKKEASPGDEVNVSVKVTGTDGKPVKSELAIMAVDTGQLILTGYKTPNPFATFYTKMGLGVTTTDSRIYLIGLRSFGEKGEPEGGGGGVEQQLRMKFLPVAYWNPAVLTDENGEAQISFSLPDNLTTFKIMAVAESADKFGSGDAEVISKKSLMVRTALPFFAGIGDKFKGSVVVHNYTDKKLAGKVKAGAEGIELSGETEKGFKIGPQEKGEFLFDFSAAKLGAAKLTFEATAGDVHDGVQLPLEVKIRRPKEVFVSFGETEVSAKEVFEPLAGVYPDFGGMDISISSTAMTGLADASFYLVQYPYECLEQKVSKAIGMIIYTKIASEFKLDVEDKLIKTYLKQINKTVKELYKYQDWEGGFKFWPDTGADPYLTVYTTHFMAIAKENGYEIEARVLERAKEFLKKILKWDEKVMNDKYYVLSLKSYALYVLALLGEPDHAYNEQLYGSIGDLSPTSRILHLMAMGKSAADMESRLTEFIRYIENNMVVTASEAKVEDLGDEWYFWNDDYYNAYVLEALLRIKPEHPLIPKIARYLLTNSKHGYWGNTHTTAAVLMALYDYIKVREKEVPEYTATIKLGVKELLSADFRGRSVKEENVRVPMKELAGITAPTDILFDKKGAGRMYYRTKLEYASSAVPLPPMEEGFTIYKTIRSYDKKRKEGDFKRGDLVVVSLEFVAPASRNYIVIDDGLPAGLEAVNFSLETAQRNVELSSSYNFHINHVEIYGDKVLVFSNYLPEGSYKFEYLAKAATKGVFSVPPAHIEEMYNPDVFGRTSDGTIEVK